MTPEKKLIQDHWQPEWWGATDCDRCPIRCGPNNSPCNTCPRWPYFVHTYLSVAQKKELQKQATKVGRWLGHNYNDGKWHRCNRPFGESPVPEDTIVDFIGLHSGNYFHVDHNVQSDDSRRAGNIEWEYVIAFRVVKAAPRVWWVDCNYKLHMHMYEAQKADPDFVPFQVQEVLDEPE